MYYIKKIQKRIIALKSSDLLKSFFILLSGSVIAQAIQLLLSPILSRIYNPAEFGIFSVFFSISYFIYAISSLRFDYAIIMQKNKSRALNLGLTAFLIATVSSILFVLIFFINQFYFLKVIKIPAEHYYWFGTLLFITILIYSYSSIFSYYFNFEKKYNYISYSTVLRVLSTILIQLFIGYFFEHQYGLIYGFIIGVILSFIYLLFHFWKEFKFIRGISKVKFSILNVKKNVDFLKYNTPHVILDNIMMHGFILYLSYVYTIDEIGSYSFANRIIRAPILLIGSTLGRVMFKQLADAYNIKKSFIGLIGSTKKILILTIFPIILVTPFIKSIFLFLFGQSWELAANISFIIIFPSILNLFILPFVNIAYVLGKNKGYFIISIINLVVILLSLAINQYYELTFVNYVKVYSLCLCITMVITFIWLYIITTRYERTTVKNIK